MHKWLGIFSRHLTMTLYIFLCYNFYLSLLRMFLKSRARTSWVLNEKGIQGSCWCSHRENCQHVHAAYCRRGEKRCVCVSPWVRSQEVGRKCGSCWSTAHPSELSLTAVATKGGIWLWPPERICSALHLRGPDVARAPARGEGSTKGRQRCRVRVGWALTAESPWVMAARNPTACPKITQFQLHCTATGNAALPMWLNSTVILAGQTAPGLL